MLDDDKKTAVVLQFRNSNASTNTKIDLGKTAYDQFFLEFSNMPLDLFNSVEERDLCLTGAKVGILKSKDASDRDLSGCVIRQ